MQRRRWLFTLGCAVSALSGCNTAPAVDIAAETAAVRARSEALATAEGAQDRVKALTYWSKDAIVQPAGAPQVAGIDAVSTLYKGFFDGGMLKAFSGTTSQLVVAASGDLAYETGVNRMTLKGPKGDLLDVGKYLAIWRKENGVWNVAALSFTSDAPAPVPAPKK